MPLLAAAEMIGAAGPEIVSVLLVFLAVPAVFVFVLIGFRRSPPNGQIEGRRTHTAGDGRQSLKGLRDTVLEALEGWNCLSRRMAIRPQAL